MNKINNLIDTIKNNDFEQYGLLSGSLGYILLLYYKNDFEALYIEIEKIIKIVEEGDTLLSYSIGLSGLLWVLNEINKEDSIDYLDTVILNIKELLKQVCTDVYQDYDFIRGATGIIHALVDLETDDSLMQIFSNYLKGLKEKTKSSEKGLYFDFYQPATNEFLTNFGLSHGMASLIQVLSRIYKKGIETNITKELVKGYVTFILNHRHLDKYVGSEFPNTAQKYGKKSRLAWCYGDLGIAIAIWQAGDNMDVLEWKQIAEEVLINTTNRTTLEDGMIVDPMVCHGTSGIAAIYNRMWRNTNNEVFLKSRNYWLEKTEKFARFEDGVSGYKYYLPQSNTWVKEYGLLEGGIGIALTFIQAESKEDIKWDRALLISS